MSNAQNPVPTDSNVGFGPLDVGLGDHHDRLPKLPRPARFWEMSKALPGHPLKAAPTYLEDIRSNLAADGMPDAVAHHDTPWLFDWLVGVSQFEGISDANAAANTAKYGIVGWDEIRSVGREAPSSPGRSSAPCRLASLS